MARVHRHNDDDDFMDPPQHNRATGRRKEGDEKKKRIRNRASQERLTTLTDRFTNDQKGAAAEMGMQVLMNVRCTNLVNLVCDWLGEIYDPASREFVIPGRGRLPLNEEYVFCTLGVPCGQIKDPYEAMTTHGNVFKMKLLMYLISAVFALTTSLHPSNKCFPILAKLEDVKNMNWCKFIADFLHDAFSNKMYQKGRRLHLMLMYVDCLDLSTVDFTGTGGPPPTHKFAVSAWTINAVKTVLAADRLMAKHAIGYSVFGGPQNFGKWMDVHSAPSYPTEARAHVEHLIGQFASGMTGLLRKLIEGWTSLSGSDSDAVARQFISFVPERTHRPTGCRGRYDYNSSQELADTQDELDGDAGLSKDDDDDMENAEEDTDDDEHAEVRVGANKGKDAPDVPPTGESQRTYGCGRRGGVAIKEGEVSRGCWAGFSWQEARTTGIHTSGSDESVSARTAEILPTLLAMKDAAVSHATPPGSVEVDAPETNLSKEDSRSSDTDSKRVRGGTPVPTIEVAEAAVHNDMPSAGDSLGTTAPSPGGADIAQATVPRAGLPPRRRSPRKQSIVVSNAPAAARSSRDESGYVPASTLFPPTAKSNVMEKLEDQSTTDAGAKPGTSDEGERLEQTAPLPAVEIPSLNLRTSKLSINIGVPYSPNKRIVNKSTPVTTDSTPHPINKPVDSATADSDMFVDLSPLDSAPQVVRGPASRHERHPMAFTPPSFSLGVSQDQPVAQDSMPVAFAFPGGMPAMMAQPMVEGRKVVKFVEPIVQGILNHIFILAGTPEEILPSLDEAYRRIEEAALQRRSSRGQGQSSFNVPADTVSEDTIRSATPGSVRQQRVVHPPPAEDYEPEVRATKEQIQLYDIVKRFCNARASSKHMKELKA
ncbi:hypothetical protein VPH35_054466 [Triticum aestivum]|uniref:Uncharacterized protein n=1 Tax=Triticum aestivum TaxID=4565 RepID=A0A077S5N7_WHEAT|nr:unnamed protein product [Triticum aestivum]